MHPWQFSRGEGLFGHGKFEVIQKLCSILVQTHEILVGGSPNSTYKNTPYRLDKSRSALAEARLKIVAIVQFTF